MYESAPEPEQRSSYNFEEELEAFECQQGLIMTEVSLALTLAYPHLVQSVFRVEIGSQFGGPVKSRFFS
jgi:hypothetical protein